MFQGFKKFLRHNMGYSFGEPPHKLQYMCILFVERYVKKKFKDLGPPAPF